MAFDFMATANDGGPWYWLMAMETDAAGQVSRVVFVQANDAGETRHPWECPLEVRHEDAPVPPPTVQLVEPAPAPLVAMGDTPKPPVAMGETPKPPAQPVALPARRGKRGRAAAAAQPALDLRQEELWSAALGAE
jgi:hypothetical protein